MPDKCQTGHWSWQARSRPGRPGNSPRLAAASCMAGGPPTWKASSAWKAMCSSPGRSILAKSLSSRSPGLGRASDRRRKARVCDEGESRGRVVSAQVKTGAGSLRRPCCRCVPVASGGLAGGALQGMQQCTDLGWLVLRDDASTSVLAELAGVAIQCKAVCLQSAAAAVAIHRSCAPATRAAGGTATMQPPPASVLLQPQP